MAEITYPCDAALSCQFCARKVSFRLDPVLPTVLEDSNSSSEENDHSQYSDYHTEVSSSTSQSTELTRPSSQPEEAPKISRYTMLQLRLPLMSHLDELLDPRIPPSFSRTFKSATLDFIHDDLEHPMRDSLCTFNDCIRRALERQHVQVSAFGVARVANEEPNIADPATFVAVVLTRREMRAAHEIHDMLRWRTDLYLGDESVLPLLSSVSVPQSVMPIRYYYLD